MAGRLRFGTVDQRALKGRPKRWRARYDDPTWTGPGRAPRITAPETFPTKAAAEAWLARVWSDVAAGTWRHPDQVRAEQEAAAAAAHRRDVLAAVTVEQWARDWVAVQKRTKAAGTFRKRRSDTNAHIVPGLGDRRLTDLTPQAISDWLDTLPSDGVRTSCYQTLRVMMTAAVDSPTTALDTNPCRVKGAGVAHAPRGERFLLSPEQVDALAAAIRPDLRALVLLLADAGLRINEALALRREDVHVGTGEAFVEVVHSVVREGSTLSLGPTKTKRPRTVQLMPATGTALADHLSTFSGPVWVFPALRRPDVLMRDTGASRALLGAMAVAGVVIPPGRYGGWHALRHYAATRFGQAGASTAAIMRRFGWTRPEQAMHYQRADADYERMILERMADGLGGGAENLAVGGDDPAG